MFSFYLRLAGLKVTIDLCKEPLKRVTRLKVKCGTCYEDLDDKKIYNVAMPAFLAGGSGGYPEFLNESLHHEQGDSDTDVLREYIITKTPIEPEIKGRINIINDVDPESCPETIETVLEKLNQLTQIVQENKEEIEELKRTRFHS